MKKKKELDFGGSCERNFPNGKKEAEAKTDTRVRRKRYRGIANSSMYSNYYKKNRSKCLEIAIANIESLIYLRSKQDKELTD